MKWQRLLALDSGVRLATNMTGVYGATLGLARDKHVNRAWDKLTQSGITAPRPKGGRLEYATVLRA